MKEYQKIFEHLMKVAKYHRFEADVCDQNILMIESVLTALEDLNHRIERLERQSPYDTPPNPCDEKCEFNDLKKRLETIEQDKKNDI